MNGPKVLIIDIETSPLLGYIWQLWDQNVSLNQIHTDWHLLSFSAKWLHSKEVIYKDQRNAKNIEDDKALLKLVWDLLDEADIVIGQNSRQFDVKKLNARFVLQGFQPPSSYKQIDTLELAKRHFGFTSNKLEYMSDKLCVKYKKLSHKKFPGFEMWKECLAGNLSAWKEMERYNKHDVLATQELYEKLIPWDSSINFNIYSEGTPEKCKCGHTEFRLRGFFYTSTGKFQRFRCKSCGAETRSGENLLSKEKRKSLRRSVPR